MKLPSAPLAAALAFAVLSPSAPAQDRIQVRAWLVQAPPATLAAAEPSASPSGKGGSAVLDPAQAEQFRSRLREAGGTVLANPRVVLNSGQRVTVDSVRELRYPSAYEPSEKDPGRFVATEFETRNVGVSLQCEAVRANGGEINLTVDLNATDFLGFIDPGAEVPAGNAPPVARLLQAPLREGAKWQPLFAVFRVGTTISLQPGETVLLGGMPESDEPDANSEAPNARVNLALITADLVPTR